MVEVDDFGVESDMMDHHFKRLTHANNGLMNGDLSAAINDVKVPLRVLIVGGGLGGLTAALALRRAGHTVTVFEQSSFASEYGAAINVPPNAYGILLRLGVDPVEAGAVELQWLTEYNKTGQSVKVNDFKARSRIWQHKYLLAHRVDLHNQLKLAASSSNGEGKPVELKTGSPVIGVDAEKAILTLKDGTTVQGDLIVGADGVHSNCRTQLTDQRPFSSGKSAYRFVIKKSDALAIPDLVEVVQKEGEMVFWFDIERRIVMYPTRNNEILNFVCIHPDRSSTLANTWNEPGSIDKLLKEFDGFDERVLKLLRMADESTLKVWKLMDMRPVDKWFVSRLCLIGDAAHPFLPHQGQGGAQALEDAVSLGVILPMGILPEEIPARLQLYQDCRKERAELVQEVTRQSGADIKVREEDHAAKVMSFFYYNCGHDEHDHSTQRLRLWKYKEQTKSYWRMPVSFGPFPGPRQDHHGLSWNTEHSTFIKASVKFKTSRTLLQNFLPSSRFSFASPSTFAYASYIQTTVDGLQWLGGKGYDYFGLYLHQVQYKKNDGAFIVGDFLAVMWENLADPILSGREELGFPKLYGDIDVAETARSWSMKGSWRNATFIKLELDGLQSCDNPVEPQSDGVLLYKYIPATGKLGVADVEYPVYVPASPKERASRRDRTRTGRIIVDSHTVQALPTLHHIVERLAELPIYEFVEGAVSRGTGLDDVSSAYRIE